MGRRDCSQTLALTIAMMSLAAFLADVDERQGTEFGHYCASLGFAVRLDRAGVSHIRPQATGRCAVGMRIGTHDLSLLRHQHDSDDCDRHRAYGDSVFLEAVTCTTYDDERALLRIFQALIFFPNALHRRHFGSLSGRLCFLGGGLVGTHA